MKNDIKQEFNETTIMAEVKKGYVLDFTLNKDTQKVEIKDFLNVTVKGAYDQIPEINYPLITITEIQNTENSKFTDLNGEHVSDLAYQIESYSGNTSEFQASESVMIMGNIINNLLTGSKYRLRRVGTPALVPLPEDNNIIRYIQRYSCSIDLDTNTIYARS